MRKALSAFCVTLAFSPTLFAADDLSVSAITANIINVVDRYASSVACFDLGVEPKNIAALTPLQSVDEHLDAEYAVWWMGDIGCAGGSGTSGSHIAIVNIGAGGYFYVDPTRSSPTVDFDTPTRHITKIIGNTHDSIVFEGVEYGEKDPNCCPSIPIRFTLKANEQGDWRLVDKKELPRKP
ncbi:MAG: hypothetical protein KA735_13040 [Burkholderiaceae bacterium]|nr:hypothetical protein [Burkholderiaceae bacterium]